MQRISLVGRCTPGNINLIDVSRLEKMRRKPLGILTSWQNVPRTLFMQISAAITEHSFFGHISVNNDDN